MTVLIKALQSSGDSVFVANYPAMHLYDYLVISDLHLGITRELYRSGFSLPSQMKSLLGSIRELKKITGAENLLVIGDVKHNIPGISWQEMREVPEFFSSLDFSKIILVKGNHDGNIERLVKDLGSVTVRKSFTVKEYFFTHGHRKISTKKENIVMGHNHPCVRLKDRMGAYYTLPCWVIGAMGKKRVILMPAFNPLSGFSVVNADGFLGPIAKHLTNSSGVYLLDGTYLGKIKDLRVD